MKKFLSSIFLLLFLITPVYAQKINDLDPQTAPSYEDFTAILHNPTSLNPVTQKTSVANLAKALGWVDVRSYASINAALAAIGSTQTTLFIPNEQTLAASLTIPSTLSLFIPKGGMIVKAPTYTLTINGSFSAGLYQVFSGFSAGDVTFGASAVKEACPEWWLTNTTPGTTDMITALDSADSTGVGIVRLSNIYAISDTWTLRSATSYLGPSSGTYIPGLEHPSSGYGAALKWIGAASGVMVKMFDIQNTVWDGIDLDGVNYTNDVTGFYYYSDNSPNSTLCTIRHCRAYNLGYGMKIGANAGGIAYQSDALLLERFNFHLVNYGIYFDSQNGTQGVKITTGFITCYKHGIHIESGSGLTSIDTVNFGGRENAPADGCYIYIGNAGGTLNINNIQGEPIGAGTGWKDIRFSAASHLNATVNISSSVINGGIIVPAGGNARINSFGNYYSTYEEDGITLSGNCVFNSVGDVFNDVNDMAHDVGVNNFITYVNSYTPSVDYYIFQFSSNQTNKFKVPFGGLATYADNATALAAGLTAGTLYRTATGQLMIVYTP
jgi:hypothetical protein